MVVTEVDTQGTGTEWCRHTDPRRDGALIFDRGAEEIQWREDGLLIKGCWNHWPSLGRRKNSSWTSWTSLVAQTVKRLPTMQETWVRSLGQDDPLEKEMATHSSSLAWKIPWTEEPGRLQSMGSQRVGHDWATLLHTSWKDEPQMDHRSKCKL